MNNISLLLVSLFSFSSVLSSSSSRFISMKLIKNNIVAETHSLTKYQPRTQNQKIYVEYLTNPKVSIVGGVGPAGSGKTLFACHAAVSALKSGNVDKIVITRPLISVDEEELGFLPGSITNKMDPWTRPIFDILGEFYSTNQIKSMVENRIVEISPLAYMRGRTFKRSFIIADEMQNSSPNQMLMMLTRIGENSKLVITGDLKQSDRSGINGLLDFTEKLKSSEDSLIKIIELNNVDVQRSLVVSHILDIYDSKKI
jgi:phosphate starvation-inducible PhoH-like protein